MDRYLYKAKRLDNGEWVQGVPFEIEGKQVILIKDNENLLRVHYLEENMWTAEIYAIEVNASTICQCTGLKDKKGKLIWENDIVRCGKNCTVTWCDTFASWRLNTSGWMYSHFFGEACKPEDVEIVGNIFDNPELLEVEKDVAEQEAIKYIESHGYISDDVKDIAIKALEDIQKYRKMEKQLEAVYGECDGLLEETITYAVKEAVAVMEQHNGVDFGHPTKSRILTDEDVDKWEAYKAIGTQEECRTAVEKQKAKKPKEYEDKFYRCPTCGNVLLQKWGKYNTKLMDKKNGLPYCLVCGQKLDWGDE